MFGRGGRKSIMNTLRGYSYALAKFVARVALVVAVSPFGFPQGVFDALTPTGLEQPGFHLNQISLFSAYSNLNETVSSPGIPGQTVSAHVFGNGISAGAGWSKPATDLSTFAVNYNVNYSYQPADSNTVSAGYLTQSLSAIWSQKLGTKWSFSLSLSGAMGSFNQLIFAPTSDQVLSSLPGTAQELAGTVVLGQTTNPDLAAAQNGASALISPQENLFYGGRFLSATLSSSLSYAISPRLSIGLGVSGSRLQTLSNQNSGVPDAFIIPQTTAAGANVRIGYELTPRTSLSGDVAYFRGISPVSSPSGAVSIGLGREVTERWFVRGSAGTGFYSGPTYNSAGIQTGTGFHELQATYSGSTGYRARSNTFIASVSRVVGNSYSLGASGMLLASAAWSWNRPGGNWSLTASAGESRFIGSGWGDNNGYYVSVGARRRLATRVSMSLQLAYSSFSGNIPEILGITLPESVHSGTEAARLSFTFGGLMNFEQQRRRDTQDTDLNP